MKKKTILTLILSVVLICISAGTVVLVQADSPLRPSDVRSTAKPAEYINEKASKTKTISNVVGEEKTLTYDSTVERNGAKDRYLDENGNKYYYDEDGELNSYVRGNPSGTQQKTEAAAVLDEAVGAEESGSVEKNTQTATGTAEKNTETEPVTGTAEKNTATEPAPEGDPYALKIPEDMLNTLTENDLRIIDTAWQKGLEFYGDKVRTFELDYYQISTRKGANTVVSFAQKYGADNSIFGQFFDVRYDWYGELITIGLYSDDFEDVNPENLAEYTEQQMMELTYDLLQKEDPEQAQVYPYYEFKQARLWRKDDGKVYLFITIHLKKTADEPARLPYYKAYIEI